MRAGRLVLIPSWLDESNSRQQFPEATLNELFQLEHFVVERAKSARHFLRAVGFSGSFDELHMVEINKHAHYDPADLLAPCLAGHDLGLISEAGVPAVADPGGAIVAKAHELGIAITPLIGPSSLLMALMASGMNGQRFTFHGYLPREEPALVAYIKEMETESKSHDTTHFFIETPYRNDKLWATMLRALQPATRLTIACDLTAPSQQIQNKSVADWRTKAEVIGKRPSVFLLFAGKIST